MTVIERKRNFYVSSTKHRKHLRLPKFFIPSTIINNMPVLDMTQRCFIMEIRFTNQKEKHS